MTFYDHEFNDEIRSMRIDDSIKKIWDEFILEAPHFNRTRQRAYDVRKINDAYLEEDENTKRDLSGIPDAENEGFQIDVPILKEIILETILDVYVNEYMFNKCNLNQWTQDLFEAHPEYIAERSDLRAVLGDNDEHVRDLKEDCRRFILSYILNEDMNIDYRDKGVLHQAIEYFYEDFKVKFVDKKRFESVYKKFKDLKYLPYSHLMKMSIPEPLPILGSWLTERMACFLHAPSGIGKSWFSLACAVAVAGGGTFAGWTAPRPLKVLVIDGEMTLHDISKNIKFLAETMGCDKDLLSENLILLSKAHVHTGAQFPKMNDPETHTYLEGIVQKHKVEMVVFDNVRTLTNNLNENDASSWQAINDLVTTLKRVATVMVIHHDRKNSKGSSEGWSGNTNAITVFEARISLQETKPEAIGDDFEGVGACFTVKFGKYRGLRSDDTLNKVFGLHPEKGWLFKEDEQELIEKMIGHLESGSFTTQKDICDKMGISQSKGTRLKQKIIAAGKMTKEQFDVYLQVATLLE